MLDNLNVEFEEMDMEELQEESGGAFLCGSGAVYLVAKKPKFSDN